MYLHNINKNAMASKGLSEFIQFMKKLHLVLQKNQINYCLKVKQIRCIHNIYKGRDVIAVLPTGYGKSITYQLLPDLYEEKIVIVVSPLNSIIEDQLKTLLKRSIPADLLNCVEDPSATAALFLQDATKRTKIPLIPKNIKDGNIRVLFSHPESLLSEDGRKLLKSSIFQEKVVACIIDESHVIELW